MPLPPSLPIAVIHIVDTVLTPSVEALAAEVADEVAGDTEEDVVEEPEIILLEIVQTYNLTTLVGAIFVSRGGCSCVCWRMLDATNLRSRRWLNLWLWLSARVPACKLREVGRHPKTHNTAGMSRQRTSLSPPCWLLQSLDLDSLFEDFNGTLFAPNDQVCWMGSNHSPNQCQLWARLRCQLTCQHTTCRRIHGTSTLLFRPVASC
jgi:hypothetical protein